MIRRALVLFVSHLCASDVEHSFVLLTLGISSEATRIDAFPSSPTKQWTVPTKGADECLFTSDMCVCVAAYEPVSI